MSYFFLPGIKSRGWFKNYLISYYQCLLLFDRNCYVVEYIITLKFSNYSM